MTRIKQHKPKTQSSVRWVMTIKFLVQLAIGIGLALAFARLVSSQNDTVELFSLTLSRTYLNLTLAGTLGGLLYSMLIDQTLEFPDWAKNDKGLKPGFIGDIFVGIAGAFIAYTFIEVLPGTSLETFPFILFAVGLVGGYGGKSVLDAASNRLGKLIEKADLTKTKLNKLKEVEELQKLANHQISRGLAPEELSKLQTQLQTVSLDPKVKERIFDVARDARRLGSRVKAYEDRINRTIPILDSLVKSTPNDDRYHAQLACAYRDSVPPRLDEAISEFQKAIELRDPTAKNNWHYELDRVVALIYKAVQERETNDENSPSSKKILADLLAIKRNRSLKRIFLEFDSGRTKLLKDWLGKNQNWIGQTPEGLSLLKQTFPSGLEPSIMQNHEWIVAPPNTAIEAITRTHLKKQPIQSSELDVDQKVEVPAGKKYTVLKYSQLTKNLDSEATEGVRPSTRQIPQCGLELIEVSEGYHEKLPDGQARAYPDPGPKGWSLPTIGYGTTRYPDGSPVKRGDIITKAEAEEYLLHYVDKKCRIALEKIPTWKQMNDNQKGALYSFAYNLGEHFYGGSNFQSITNVCKSPQRWNDKAWVEQQFGKYVKSAGKTLSGLVKRRKAEAKLFCTPQSSVKVDKVLKSSEITDGHCLVELDYGAGTWYIWSAHWHLPWKNISQKQDSPEKASIPKHHNPAVQGQIDRLTQYLPEGKTLNLDVKTKYFSQRDNYRDAHRTCNSSSNAMYLDWLLRVTGKPGLDDDKGYIRKVFGKGDTIDHNVQTKTIEQYGFKTKWMMDKDLPFVEDLVDTGFPVTVNILHRGRMERPRGGHVIMLIGRKNGEWIAHDPYGTLKSNYRVFNGAYSRISEKEFKARWEGGYRTLRE
ncbi:MAG: glycoside hydrolase family protein [Spirulina sp.]